MDNELDPRRGILLDGARERAWRVTELWPARAGLSQVDGGSYRIDTVLPDGSAVLVHLSGNTARAIAHAITELEARSLD